MMDRRTNGLTDLLTDGRTDGQSDGRMEVLQISHRF